MVKFTQNKVNSLKFHALLHSKYSRFTQINPYYSQILYINMSKESFDYKLPKKEKLVNQESILRLLQSKPLRNKEICEKLEAKSNRVSYHIKELLKNKKIEKNGDVYSIIKESPSKLHELIFTVLEELDIGGKSLVEILEKIKKLSSNFDTLDENELQKILEKDLRLSVDFLDNKFRLSFNELVKRGICWVCREKITEDQLKVGMLIFEPWNGTSNNPLHATCLAEINVEADESGTVCNYCGLDLRRRHRDPTKITPSLDKALEKIYDDPFSQIFSYLDPEHYEPPAGDQVVYGFAHYKEKDGKKFHPYCLRIVEGQKS